MKTRKIYVASSWRNEHQPAVVELLRMKGHSVYDFRNEGFSWKSIDGDWLTWTPQQYLAALKHGYAEAGFQRDMNALKWCDTCIFVMPCGPSASMEAGWAKGSGRPTACFVPGMREPDLMVKMFDIVTDSWLLVERWLEEL